jgi:hypothetical protein
MVSCPTGYDGDCTYKDEIYHKQKDITNLQWACGPFTFLFLFIYLFFLPLFKQMYSKSVKRK